MDSQITLKRKGKHFVAYEGTRKLGTISRHGSDPNRWRHAHSGLRSYPDPLWAATNLAVMLTRRNRQIASQVTGKYARLA